MEGLVLEDLALEYLGALKNWVRKVNFCRTKIEPRGLGGEKVDFCQFSRFWADEGFVVWGLSRGSRIDMVFVGCVEIFRMPAIIYFPPKICRFSLQKHKFSIVDIIILTRRVLGTRARHQLLSRAR